MSGKGKTATVRELLTAYKQLCTELQADRNRLLGENASLKAKIALNVQDVDRLSLELNLAKQPQVSEELVGKPSTDDSLSKQPAKTISDRVFYAGMGNRVLLWRIVVIVSLLVCIGFGFWLCLLFDRDHFWHQNTESQQTDTDSLDDSANNQENSGVEESYLNWPVDTAVVAEEEKSVPPPVNVPQAAAAVSPVAEKEAVVKKPFFARNC